MDNLEVNKFLETRSPPKLNQEEIIWTKQLLECELECIIKNIPCKQKFRMGWLHWRILPNIQRTYTDPSQTLPKDWRWENIPKVILWSHYYPDTKTRQRHYQKRKLQVNISDEYRCRNSQQNISKLDPTTRIKGSYIMIKLVSLRNTKMVPHTPINMHFFTLTMKYQKRKVRKQSF